MALAWSGFASPRQRMRKRSAIEGPGRCRSAEPAGGPTPRADCATKLSAITDARARSSRACSSLMSMSWRKPHSGASVASARLHVDARVARADGQRVRTAGGRPGREASVDEQAPDLLEGHAADELLDVDAAVAQRAALPVGLGDLGGEGDDALQAGLDFGHVGGHVASTGSGSGISARAERAGCDAVVLLALQRAQHREGRERREREDDVGGGPRRGLDEHAEGVGREHAADRDEGVLHAHRRARARAARDLGGGGEGEAVPAHRRDGGRRPARG